MKLPFKLPLNLADWKGFGLTNIITIDLKVSITFNFEFIPAISNLLFGDNSKPNNGGNNKK